MGNIHMPQGDTYNPDVLLGGTYIHNSKTFLEDVESASQQT